MADQVIKMPRKREFLTLSCGFLFLTIFLLVTFDILEFSDTHRVDLMYLGIFHVFLIGLIGFCLFLTIPDFLLIYTEEGIRWPSVKGYKLLRWSDINAAALNVTFWRGTRVVLSSDSKKIVINSQLFANADEAIAEIRKRVPRETWK